VKCKSI